jgi:hypothetical protein
MILAITENLLEGLVPRYVGLNAINMKNEIYLDFRVHRDQSRHHTFS